MKFVIIMIFMIEVGVIMSTFCSAYLPIFADGSGSSIFNIIANRNDTSLYPLFSQLSRSVVQVVSINPSTTNLPSQNTTTEVAAGFAYDTLGHIVTANHVLGGANEVTVIFENGDTHNATVIGRDPYTDIAVLRIVDLFGSYGTERANELLAPVILANSSTVKIGDYVTTIGYPFASKVAMTSGIVSQTDFLLSFSSLGYLVPDTIETDVAVNPGNSGSPLIDINGEVVGLIYGRLNPTTAPLGQFSGLSVAIPSNAIKKIVPSLIHNGTYIHPDVGIIGSTLTVDLAKHFQNIPDNLKGVVVNSISRGGTADKAGINAATTDKYGQRQLGDIITSLDGHKIPDIESFLSYIQENKRAGEIISFIVYRDGNYMNLNATLQAVNQIQ